jgi:hypothetical protein
VHGGSQGPRDWQPVPEAARRTFPSIHAPQQSGGTLVGMAH